MEHMKWWGWGQQSVTFTHRDKPDLAPFIKKKIGLDVNKRSAGIIEFDSLSVPEPAGDAELIAALEEISGTDNVWTDPQTRVVHGYGKSLRDLLRIRNGDVGRLPDVVVYPAGETQIAAIVKLALERNAVVIPFGGGTNISGSLEAPRDETRTIISIDMMRLNRLIEIDETARTARIQAGVYGPALEAELNKAGWTLGHFPDSFKHSTLGGWIATRSSGMQSDKYGDIADLTRSVRVVTPLGILETRNVPSESTGPSVREMILGSEGRLGVITEATVHVHRIAEQRTILGYFFPSWPVALRAMRDIAASDASPIVTRVSDPNETAFSFATKKDSTLADNLKSTALKTFLTKRKKYDLSQMCLSFIGYEGTAEHVKRQRKLVGDIVAQHNGICVGSSPGELYDQKKFDTPYIRDFLLDRGALADVSETAAPWSKLQALYDGVVERTNKAFNDLDVRSYLMCHLSHSYHSGACLYFTFAFVQSEKVDAIEQYDIVKSAIQQAFIDFGGTLSHHHAVGLEHAQWLEENSSVPGVQMVRVLLDGVDPGHNFNPGKIIS